MNSEQVLRLTQFNKNQKETSATVERCIAGLNNAMSAAIEHIIYAKLNPDANVDSETTDKMGSRVDALQASYMEMHTKVVDLLAVRAKTMTIEDLHTKYPVDLTVYSSDLG